jgi:hypothetical protein
MYLRVDRGYLLLPLSSGGASRTQRRSCTRAALSNHGSDLPAHGILATPTASHTPEAPARVRRLAVRAQREQNSVLHAKPTLDLLLEEEPSTAPPGPTAC